MSIERMGAAVKVARLVGLRAKGGRKHCDRSACLGCLDDIAFVKLGAFRTSASNEMHLKRADVQTASPPCGPKTTAAPPKRRQNRRGRMISTPEAVAQLLDPP